MNKIELPQRGLYAITGQFDSAHRLIERVELAIQGGAAIIQYRDKNSTLTEQQEIARQLLTVCNRLRTPLIINDDIELAKTIGAHGVHLGQNDSKLAQAKISLPSDAIIGITCYNSIERAIEAEKQGASYVAFGRFFFSKSKPEASTASLSILAQAKQQLSLPVTAIGGINTENGSKVLEAGADLLAVIDGVFGEDQPDQAARRFVKLFN